MPRKTSRTWAQSQYKPKAGSFYRPPTTYAPPRDRKRPVPRPPQVDLAKKGDTMLDLAQRHKADPMDFMAVNPDMTKPMAGTAYNIPPIYPETGLSVRPGYTPEPDPKVHLETAEAQDKGTWDMQFPEGWNFAQTMAAVPYMTMDYASKYYGGHYTEYGGLGAETPPAYSPTKTARGWGMPTDPRYGTPTEELPYFPGIPDYHAWAQDSDTGAWTKKPSTAIFDALYEFNDIDPTDDAMVEWFWSFADEDMLGVGELFDVLDWGGEDGYGGYGAPATYGLGTPSRMAGRGQRPTRGNYAGYLSLTSWRI